MPAEPKPIFLLADSQPLFPRGTEPSLLDRVKEVLEVEPAQARAAYLGASNGDAPEFYEMFVAAMGDIGVTECKHVFAEADAAAVAFVAEAEIVLLAGGDTAVGWAAFEKSGLVEVLRAVPSRGGVLMGVSAGAIQIGMRLLSLIPYVISPHDEPTWKALASQVRQSDGLAVGIGIPRGGAVVAHSDSSIESVRKPFTEVVLRDGGIHMADVLSVVMPRSVRTLAAARAVLEELGAPPRLLRHGELVAEAAEELLEKMRTVGVSVDEGLVRAGAVLHDTGKIRHALEMHTPGAEHEEAGQAMLRALGVRPEVARCCVSHAQWKTMKCSLEELLVALADALWKGVRRPELETMVIDTVATLSGADRWRLLIDLDTCFEKIAERGPERLDRSHQLE